MLVVFGFALLVLAAAIVVLFAMMGELSSRIPEAGAAQRDTRVRPVEDAKIGHAPQVWPAGLPDPGDAVLLVLSTACGSCKDVAGQLAAAPAPADWPEVAVIVSTAGRQAGADFVDTHGLGRYPHYIDEGGEWTFGEFGVQLSPTALVLRSGQLTSAHVFNDVASLRSTIENPPEPEQTSTAQTNTAQTGTAQTNTAQTSTEPAISTEPVSTEPSGTEQVGTGQSREPHKEVV